MRLAMICLLSLVAAACSEAGNPGAPGDLDDHTPYAGIDGGDVVHLVGTEPFWGGKVQGSVLSYTTPDNPQGETVTVKSFGGRGGLSYSGRLTGGQFDLTVTPGKCSDGMSDRLYPYVVMLSLTEETRNGCAWTDKQPFTETTDETVASE